MYGTELTKQLYPNSLLNMALPNSIFKISFAISAKNSSVIIKNACDIMLDLSVFRLI